MLNNSSYCWSLMLVLLFSNAVYKQIRSWYVENIISGLWCISSPVLFFSNSIKFTNLHSFLLLKNILLQKIFAVNLACRRNLLKNLLQWFAVSVNYQTYHSIHHSFDSNSELAWTYTEILMKVVFLKSTYSLPRVIEF